MKAEIITIGDEILIGQITNTNASWLAKQLVDNGIQCTRITTVGDSFYSIKEALKKAKEENDLVIITGGLGPTNDDITKKVLCDFFNDKLVLNKKILSDISDFFERKKRTNIIDLNRNQALVPSKAKIIRNSMGTAPGIWFSDKESNILSLPGVPYEMKFLFDYFLKDFKKLNKLQTIYHKTVYVRNVPESQIADKIKDWENNLNKKIKLAYLPRPGMVRLRLSILGDNEKNQKELIDFELEKLKKYIVFSELETDLNKLVYELLMKSGKSISVAESCTSGIIASKLTLFEGSSSFFKGGVVVYSDTSKHKVLGVSKNLIKEKSSVSKKVAKSMAEKVSEKFNSDFAISSTGFASETKNKECTVGQVYIGLKTPKSIVVNEFLFSGDRQIIISQVKDKAFEMLIDHIKKAE
tara:strand:+ start:1657 stop:2889 length:1233 start_codon:yes stop_codon:yes gene_type:complete